MNDSNRALSEVPALIEERRKYEGWLAALEARRDTTPGHVFERVQSDYRNRLQQVAEKLTSHRGALDEERASIESRLSLLEAEEQMRRDERAELELRTQVGELSAHDAADALRSLDDTLSGLTGEKTSMREKIDAVREMLGDGKPAAPAPEPVAPPKRVTGAIGPANAAAVNAAASEAPASSAQGSFDELAFLSSVVGAERNAADARRTPPRSAAQEKLAEAEAAAVASAPAPVDTAPAPVVSAPAPATMPEVEVEVEEAPVFDDGAGHQADSPMSGVRGSGTGVIRNQSASESLLAGLATRKDRPSGADAPLASHVPGNTPIVLRASGAIEQSKTLKCNECGAMNYATEWYCERCGAELAAL